jgi:hypothetical protein
VGRSAPAFRSASAFHGGFASPAGRYGAARGPISNASRPLSLNPAVHTQRPNFYNRRPGYTASFRDRRPYYGAGIPYVSGWVDPDYLDYPDNGGYDSSANPPDDSINGYAPQGTDQGAPSPYTEQASAEPQPALPTPPPENEEAVTLIFKDGRPAEQIHNYALTRTTLYVSDGHRREIPVDQLDLAATEKANHDAGVDFHIPGATQ